MLTSRAREGLMSPFGICKDQTPSKEMFVPNETGILKQKLLFLMESTKKDKVQCSKAKQTSMTSTTLLQPSRCSASKNNYVQFSFPKNDIHLWGKQALPKTLGHSDNLVHDSERIFVSKIFFHLFWCLQHTLPNTTNHICLGSLNIQSPAAVIDTRIARGS
jgi:hypothetical protein